MDVASFSNSFSEISNVPEQQLLGMLCVSALAVMDANCK